MNHALRLQTFDTYDFLFYVCVCVCISMEINTADDEPTTWLRSSLRATEVTFTPWQEMRRAINPPMHIHMCTRTHAMNNRDVLCCRPYLTRSYTLVCSWGKLDHLSQSGQHRFPSISKASIYFVLEKLVSATVPKSWIYLNSSAKHNLL